MDIAKAPSHIGMLGRIRVVLKCKSSSCFLATKSTKATKKFKALKRLQTRLLSLLFNRFFGLFRSSLGMEYQHNLDLQARSADTMFAGVRQPPDQDEL